MKQETQDWQTNGFVGSTVIVETFRLVSGASSVPIPQRDGEVIGEMTRVNNTTYAIFDNATEVARISGVYSIEADVMRGQRVILVNGWLATGIWGRWIVQK